MMQRKLLPDTDFDQRKRSGIHHSFNGQPSRFGIFGKRNSTRSCISDSYIVDVFLSKGEKDSLSSQKKLSTRVGQSFTCYANENDFEPDDDSNFVNPVNCKVHFRPLETPPKKDDLKLGQREIEEILPHVEEQRMKMTLTCMEVAEDGVSTDVGSDIDLEEEEEGNDHNGQNYPEPLPNLSLYTNGNSTWHLWAHLR